MKIFKVLIMVLLIWLMYSCQQSPLAPFTDPTVYTGTWSSPWIIYDEVLNTLGGNILIFPATGDPSLINIVNTGDGTAYHGKFYFRFTWSGGDLLWSQSPPANPAPILEHSFAGYDLIVASNPAFYTNTPGIDLTGSHYTKIVFYARGWLSAGNVAQFVGPNGYQRLI